MPEVGGVEVDRQVILPETVAKTDNSALRLRKLLLLQLNVMRLKKRRKRKERFVIHGFRKLRKKFKRGQDTMDLDYFYFFLTTNSKTEKLLLPHKKRTFRK
jgi:hypothetical protein